jgi:hypothetical protein
MAVNEILLLYVYLYIRNVQNSVRNQIFNSYMHINYTKL